jgi:hypothetical protein
MFILQNVLYHRRQCKTTTFSQLQRSINQLIDGDKDDIDGEASPYYQQLFDSVKYIDVCFNTELQLEECTAWSSTDIIVDKWVSNEKISFY